MIARVAADGSFLGWGPRTESEWERNPRLNPVPVVEVTASFVFTYRRLLGMLAEPVAFVHVHIELRNAVVEDRRLYLTKHYEHGIQNVFRPQRWEVQRENSTRKLAIPASQFEAKPEVVAAELVEAFAGFFDMYGDEIPFTTATEGGREIDIASLRRL